MSYMGVNLLAVVVAAVATMILGFLWYSPLLFARPWMNLMGYAPDDKAKQDEMRKGAGKLYTCAFLASLVTAFILDKLVAITSIHSALYGMKLGVALWLGFVTTVQFTDKLFGRRPARLYLINTGYQLVCYLAMGAILAVWPR